MGNIGGKFVVSMEHKGLASYDTIGTYQKESEEIRHYSDALGRSIHQYVSYLPVTFSDNRSHKPLLREREKNGYR